MSFEAVRFEAGPAKAVAEASRRGSREAAVPIRVGFIVGPTGVGKSGLALEVARRLDAEIVNGDSRQLYRGMDIATARPAVDDLRSVRHHLIGVRDPDQPVDVATFVRLAREAIADIHRRGRNVLVVGGSGLYLKALRGGIFKGPPACAEIRARLAEEAARTGRVRLHERLRKVDPAAARKISPRDLYRIIRALEVFELTGEPISTHQRRHHFSHKEYEILTVGISMERGRLYEAIDRRFERMMAAGLVEELRTLIAAGNAPDGPPLNAIGYRHLASFIRGEVRREEAVALAQRDTRRFAKRQLTWFRREPGIIWVDTANGPAPAVEIFERFFTSRSGCGDDPAAVER